jgi:nucleoside-diphosphate-sugar epimerase
MIYGRGADLNISRLVRQLRRYRVALQAGGDQLVQPVHVDDLCDLLERHLAATPVPAGLMGKPVDVGGDAALPVCELLDDLVQLTAATQFRFVFGSRALRAMAVAGSLVGLRPDQVERLLEDKTAQNTVATEALGWHPEPTAVRLEQAVSEAGS